MKLHHIAFWTKNIEILEAFYVKYFNGRILFCHSAGNFKCVFLEICNSVRIELMTTSDLSLKDIDEKIGYSHLSLELDSKEEVRKMTEFFIKENVTLEKSNEQYDDGFYESSVRDPDGNIIELAFIDRSINSAV